MAGKFMDLVNRVRTGPKRLWRQRVQPLHRRSCVRVGVTRGYFGLGPQVPGMQWGGGINIEVERNQLKILAVAANLPTDKAKTKPAITLLRRIQKAKVSFEHLQLADYRALKADLIKLSQQKHNGALATVAQNVLSLEGVKYDAAIARLEAEESSVVEAAPAIPGDEGSILSGLTLVEQSASVVQPSLQPTIFSRTISGGQEGIITGLDNVGGISTKGGRAANQDAVVVFSNSDTGAVSIGVFDGMGGHAHGEKASLIAASLAEQSFDNVLKRTHQKIHEAKQATRSDMGSTGIVAQIEGNLARIESIGDSRAILIKADGSINLLTPDDNFFIAGYSMYGKIDSVETLSFPLSDQTLVAGYWQAAEKATGPAKILSQSLGLTSQMKETRGQLTELSINTAEVELEEGDLLILCSDGIHDYLDFASFQTVIKQNKNKSPEQIAQALHNAAIVNMDPAAEKGDNITVAVYQQPAVTQIEVIDDGAMGEQTQQLMIDLGVPVSEEAFDGTVPEESEVLLAEPMTPAEDLATIGQTVVTEVEQPPVVDLGPLEDEEEVGVPAEIILEEPAAPTSGPAVTPTAKPAAPAPQDDSTEARLEEVLATVHDQGRPRQGVPGALTAQSDDDASQTAMVDMGDPTVVGTQGLGTDKETVLEGLMEIAIDPTIVSTEADIIEFLTQLSSLEISFVDDEDVLGQISFTRLVLLDQLKELKGGE